MRKKMLLNAGVLLEGPNWVQASKIKIKKKIY